MSEKKGFDGINDLDFNPMLKNKNIDSGNVHTDKSDLKKTYTADTSSIKKTKSADNTKKSKETNVTNSTSQPVQQNTSKKTTTVIEEKPNPKPKIIKKQVEVSEQSTDNQMGLAVLIVLFVLIILYCYQQYGIYNSNKKNNIDTTQIAKEDVSFTKPPKVGEKSSKYILSPAELRWEYKQQIVIDTIKQHAKSEVALRELKRMQREYNLLTRNYYYYEDERENARQAVENIRKDIEYQAIACVTKWNAMTIPKPTPFYEEPKGKSSRNKAFTLAELRWLHKRFIMREYMAEYMAIRITSSIATEKFEAFCRHIDSYLDSEGSYWFCGDDDKIAKKQVRAKSKSIKIEAQRLLEKWNKTEY